ncbi:hypothetical protein GOB57_24265 [Sinorhizobium meliloti]|nr:hypothetical protein [Sinorhizobium meliloti]
MDTTQRFDRIADYLLDSFSGGNASVSKHDVIDDDGTILGDEAFAVLRNILNQGLVIGDGRPVNALQTLVQAWSEGFEMASGDDLTDDDEHVGAVFAAYRAKPARSAGPKL